MPRTVLAVMLFAAACAKGTATTDVDAKPARADAAPSIDAPEGTPDAAQMHPDAAPGTPDAMVTPPDAMVTTPDAMVAMPDAVVLGNGDTCATANDVTAQATAAGGFQYNGDTTGMAGDITTSSACTGYTETGPDQIFIVQVPAGKTLTATVIPDIWDASIAIVSNCQANPTCVDGSDSGFEGDSETASTTAASAATYYVVVDGFLSTEYGAYSLSIKVQ